MPDPIFHDPRLVRLYDPLDPVRDDLDAYVDLADQLGAASALDLGCGTGTLACLLAGRGLEVVGLDPAEASLEVARTKPGAETVRWLLGTAADLPPLDVDLVVMTGNVAQVFLADEDLDAVLRAARAALAPSGHLAFEVRDPAARAWTSWARSASLRTTAIDGIGDVTSWVELLATELPIVSFRWTYRFEATGEVLTSDSTLRFRSRDEVAAAVVRAGLEVVEVRQAPDRPGLEHVFVCRRTD